MDDFGRAERKKTLDKGREVAVKKRNDNIALRAEARRNKRMGIKDKGKKDGGQGKGKKGKGTGRPGFEGGRKEKTRKA